MYALEMRRGSLLVTLVLSMVDDTKEKDAKGILVDDKIIEETRNLGYAGCLGNVPKE
jgi:hypothetical protein